MAWVCGATGKTKKEVRGAEIISSVIQGSIQLNPFSILSIRTEDLPEIFLLIG
jgi:hypothetical protein